MALQGPLLSTRNGISGDSRGKGVLLHVPSIVDNVLLFLMMLAARPRGAG